MASPGRVLVSLHVSPWSERAKWALDHHGLPYRVVQHIPVIGERRLRRLVGPDKPRATVPVLIAADEVLTESWDIARYADREGDGEKLIPVAQEPEVKAWADLADEGMQAGRALVVAGILRTPAALDEQIPPAVPRWVRSAMRPVSRALTRAFARKYALPFDALESEERKVRSVLARLRAGLSTRSPYLLGAFSYADVAMATLLQGVAPVGRPIHSPGHRHARGMDEPTPRRGLHRPGAVARRPLPRQAPGPRARVTPGAGPRRGAESDAIGARRTSAQPLNPAISMAPGVAGTRSLRSSRRDGPNEACS
jgi:glutathione S-transferase